MRIFRHVSFFIYIFFSNSKLAQGIFMDECRFFVLVFLFFFLIVCSHSLPYTAVASRNCFLFLGSCWLANCWGVGILPTVCFTISFSFSSYLLLFLLSSFWCISTTKTMGGTFSLKLELNMVHVKGRIFI